MKPSVLILDEPAAGLDPYARDEILNNIKNMHERLGITVILVSHSMEDISRLADRILVMNNGEVEMFDTVAKVFGNARRLSEIGLAVPQISTIFDKLRNEGIMLPRDVYTVDDAVNVLSNLLR
jgi:energy-coupling factor transport system ATP-binding protein